MSTIGFRAATADDVETLIAMRCAFLAEATGGEPPGPAVREAMRRYFLEALPTSEFTSMLALADDAVVAISGLVRRRVPPSGLFPTGREAYIMNMYTVPAWRGRGIATELLRRLVELARLHGCGKITLHAFPKAAPIYARAGFTVVDGEMRLDLRAQP
ncbi:MAG: GNAT family N-acetyltransferase [Phycisphaerales bacterium]|nr:GNAT family N-acetyltransferase [Phycisphaerales bacterium]